MQAIRRKRGCLFYIKRGLLMLIILIVGLPTAGFLYESVMIAGDAQRYPMLGQLVNVEGHNMHIYCTGAGSPTVILESGAFDFSFGWALTVQPALSKQTRVCSYDRLGYGWSEPGTTPRTPRQIAHELYTLLTNAGITGPYIMVGASYGARYNMMFAIEHPQEVVGMVWVDGRPWQGEMVMTAAQVERFITNNQFNRQLMTAMGRFGIARLLPSISVPNPEVSWNAKTEYAAFKFRSSSVDASLYEWAYGDANNAELVAKSSLRDRPLVVLEAPNDDSTWGELQKIMATYSSNSQHVVVQGSGHAIALDRPSAVINAIQAVIEAARTGKPL